MSLEEALTIIANREEVKEICEPNVVEGMHTDVHSGHVLRVLYAIDLFQREWERRKKK